MNIATTITDTPIGSIWLAWLSELGDASPVGIGDTKSDAIADLRKVLEETDE
jgi:hypothetical protein